jgi:N-acetylmuramoyl-L-alanine amidase
MIMGRKFLSVALILSMSMLLLFSQISWAAQQKSEKKAVKSAHSGKKGQKATAAKSKVKKKVVSKKGAATVPLKAVSAATVASTVKAVEPLPVAPSPSAVVKELRYWSNPDYTRIAVTLDREARFEYHQLPTRSDASVPPRLYLDISDARVGSGVKDLPIGDGLLRTARIAQYRPDIVRVVLDLDSIKDYKVFTFADPFRILIDVKGERKPEITAVKESIQGSRPFTEIARSEPAEEKMQAAVRTKPGKLRRIVVDPGHGGHDPGAIGAGGTREKDIVLQLGLKLARKLKEDLGIDAVLTRSTDVFVELQERTAIANKVGADLFVSIHANASLNRNANGIETYYLNLAKTEKAAQLAAKENGTTLEKVSLLQAVLFDLMANYKLNDSAHLAEEVQKALYGKVNGHYPVKSLGVKQGPFYVLVGATMPSILVETAFLSNEREEERLKDPRYQDLTAEGILAGIKGYSDSLK